MYQPTLPGVFENNPVNAAMNGALWSIRSEVLFYLLIPFWMFFCKRIGNMQSWMFVLVAVQCADLLMLNDAWATYGNLYLIHIGYLIPFAFFVTGSLLYLYREQLEMYATRLLPICLLMFLSSYMIGKENMPLILRVVPLAMLVVIIGGYFRYLGNWGRYGDLSYGIYVYHYPILQTLIAIGLFSAMPFATAMLAVVLTVFAGLASWHWIEKPFLSKKSHYIQAESAATSAINTELEPA
ncbi:MAG: acyltransferase [Planctomycetaceae bacterium]|nr:acyltransferase [Planctomycetaceae bacterium]